MFKKTLLLFCFVLSPSALLAAAPIVFNKSANGANGAKIEIAFVGDLLIHYPLQLKASTQGFESLWQEVIPYLKSADIAYGNLEGPIASGINRHGKSVSQPQTWNFSVYSDYPMFNYHPSLANAIKNSGFTIVSTANNHALDRYGLGADKTIDALTAAGVAHVGSRKSSNDSDAFIKIIEKKGVKTAWIACTDHTNGMKDNHHQILHCRADKIVDLVNNIKGSVDAVIICPHWGNEYQTSPSGAQRSFAQRVLDAGATAVVGSHPHVMQPVVKYMTKDGRETLIAYSLGNFVSFQGRGDAQETRSTIVLLLDLVKDQNQTTIQSVKFVPLQMQNRRGTANIKVHVLPKNQRSTSHHIIYRNIPRENDLRF